MTIHQPIDPPPSDRLWRGPPLPAERRPSAAMRAALIVALSIGLWSGIAMLAQAVID